MAINPDLPQNSPAMQWFWKQIDAFDPSMALGGIYVDKPGYHNIREHLTNRDYSVGQVGYDREGSSNYGAAIDLTPSSPEKMRVYTKRLDDAARRLDPRLYIDGVPVLREFIGTRDSKNVYCYVLIGGKPLGVVDSQGNPADRGPDPGRDKSHLWHIHLSFIRRFSNSRRAFSGVLSILTGESLADWEYPLLTQGDLNAIRTIVRDVVDDYVGDVVPRWSDTGGPVPTDDPNPKVNVGPGIFYVGATVKRIENYVRDILNKLDTPA